MRRKLATFKHYNRQYAGRDVFDFNDVDTLNLVYPKMRRTSYGLEKDLGSHEDTEFLGISLAEGEVGKG